MPSPYEIYWQVKAAALRSDVKLEPHQEAGIQKLLANNGSLVIAHGMGTGKTPTSIGGIERMRERGMAHKTLVVAPANLRDNYVDDGVHKFTDRRAVRFGPKGELGSHHISQAKLPEADYYVVSNEMFRKAPHQYLARTGADTVVWDEAHRGRDTSTLNYAAMMAIRPKVKNFVALTGTPVMNHPRDIVPLLDVTTNKTHQLGPASSFDRSFIGERVKYHGPLSFFGIGVKSTEEFIKNKPYLQQELSKHVHYVPTDEVAKGMPEKRVHDVEVPMSTDQAKLYDFALAKVDPIARYRIRNNLPVGTHEAQHIFGMITQARQASNALHPLDSSHDALSSAKHTPKLRRVLDDVDAHLRAHPKHKAIIYTNFVHGGVDSLVAGLKEKGHDPGTFIGTTHQKPTERTAHVHDYLSGKRRVMIMNTAGNEGLNLPGTTAHYTLDPHFNPATMDQAEARGIRAGSPVHKVDVYRYRSVLPRPFGVPVLPRDTGTDDWIYGIADRKEKLNGEFLGLMKEPKTR